MNSPELNLDSLPPLVGIGDAARVLGVSRTTVQKMVDSGTLEAMRTTGGHRRIVRQSIERHLQARLPGAQRRHDSRRLRVVIAEHDALQRERFREQVLSYHLPLEVTMCSDAVDALLQIERRKPHMVIADLQLSPFDGYQLLKILHDQPALLPPWLMATTRESLGEVTRRGGVGDALLMHGTPAWDRVRGLLEAACIRELGAAAVLAAQAEAMSPEAAEAMTEF